MSLLSGLLSQESVTLPPTPSCDSVKTEERIALADALDQLVNQPESDNNSVASATLKMDLKTEGEEGQGHQGGDQKPQISEEKIDGSSSVMDSKAVVAVGAMFGTLTPSRSTAAQPKPKIKKSMRLLLIPRSFCLLA